MPFDLDGELWASMLRGLVLTDYQLLLGAGASMDSTDRNGNKLPSGARLRDELVDDFVIPTQAGGVSLQRVFDAAKSRASKDGMSLRDYIVDRFCDCCAADWYEFVATTRWGAIWTLNIDDVLQGGYANAGAKAEQRLATYLWSERFAYPDAQDNEVQCVHLHGSASHLPPNSLDGLVFDIVEYLRANAARHAWHRIFSDQFEVNPFLIVGASLADEIDLAEIIRRGNRSLQEWGRPSLIVSPAIDGLAREEFESWGLIPVETTASEFFNAIGRDLRDYEREFAAETPGGSARLDSRAARFLKQFQRLKPDARLQCSSGHDLYAGHDPEWPDIVADRDALFGRTERVAASVRKHAEAAEAKPTVTLISGVPFSGKSVALLRVAREVVRGPADAWLFVDDERIDVEAMLWWLRQDDSPVFFFDGIADHARDIATISGKCRAEGLRFTVVGAERAYRRPVVVSEVGPSALDTRDIVEFRRLSEADIMALVGKLGSARRLGKLSGQSRNEQVAHFKADPQRLLFDGMATLEGGQGFVERLTAQYHGIADEGLRLSYATACVAYSVGYPVSVPVLCNSAGVDIDMLLAACSSGGALADVLTTSRSAVRPRHRRLASVVANSVLDADELFVVTQALARNLAPYVSTRSMHRRTVEYLLARELMSARNVVDWLGSSDEQDLGVVEAWYEGLKDVYDWNARYWEQRAIASSHVGAFDKAESYAAHAVVVRRDSFTLTTLGAILLRKSYDWATVGSDESWDYWRRATKALREAAQQPEGRHELPYLRFFEHTLHLVTGDPHLANAEVVAEWEHWEEAALNVAYFGQGDGEAQLKKVSTGWNKARAAKS